MQRAAQGDCKAGAVGAAGDKGRGGKCSGARQEWCVVFWRCFGCLALRIVAWVRVEMRCVAEVVRAQNILIHASALSARRAQPRPIALLRPI